MDNLEHGWIVDGVGVGEGKDIFYCHCCWKTMTEDDDYENKGFGEYICRECLIKESKNG